MVRGAFGLWRRGGVGGAANSWLSILPVGKLHAARESQRQPKGTKCIPQCCVVMCCVVWCCVVLCGVLWCA